jgi:hypothetical protein
MKAKTGRVLERYVRPPQYCTPISQANEVIMRWRPLTFYCGANYCRCHTSQSCPSRSFTAHTPTRCAPAQTRSHRTGCAMSALLPSPRTHFGGAVQPSVIGTVADFACRRTVDGRSRSHCGTARFVCLGMSLALLFTACTEFHHWSTAIAIPIAIVIPVHPRFVLRLHLFRHLAKYFTKK